MAIFVSKNTQNLTIRLKFGPSLHDKWKNRWNFNVDIPTGCCAMSEKKILHASTTCPSAGRQHKKEYAEICEKNEILSEFCFLICDYSRKFRSIIILYTENINLSTWLFDFALTTARSIKKIIDIILAFLISTFKKQLARDFLNI